jgi:hypothetical protein
VQVVMSKMRQIASPFEDFQASNCPCDGPGAVGH